MNENPVCDGLRLSTAEKGNKGRKERSGMKKITMAIVFMFLSFASFPDQARSECFQVDPSSWIGHYGFQYRITSDENAYNVKVGYLKISYESGALPLAGSVKVYVGGSLVNVYEDRELSDKIGLIYSYNQGIADVECWFSIDGASDGTQIKVTHNDGSSSKTYADWNIEVTAPEIYVKKGTLSISDGGSYTMPGNIQVGQDTEETFTIYNSGDCALEITTVTENSSQFYISQSPDSTVAPGGNADFRVTFEPTSSGAHYADLKIYSNDHDESPYDIRLTGNAVSADSEITVKKSTTTIYDGGSYTIPEEVKMGEAFVTTISIYNDGDANLTIGDISVSPETDFYIDRQATTPVPPDGSTYFRVMFNPQSRTPSTKSATIEFVNNDSNENPFNFTIIGNVDDSLPNLEPSRPTGWSDKIVVTNRDGDTYLTTEDSVYVDYAFKNTGDAPTEATFYTKLYIDGDSKHTTTTTAPFEAGQEKPVEDVLGIGALSEGEHTVTVSVDFNENVEESSESDNTYTTTIFVHSPDAECTDVLEPNDTYDAAHVLTLDTYSNDGLCMSDGDADWFQFNFYSKIYYFKIQADSSGPYGFRFDIADQTVTIETVSVNSSDVDTMVYLYDSDHATQLAADNDGGTGNFSKIVKTLDVTCAFPDLDSSDWEYEAIMFLCERGIVRGYPEDGSVKPDEPINRAELAKIAYLAVFGEDVATIADYFPTPFYDLQDENAYYYRYAKALSYLEFRTEDLSELDGVPPFDRDKASFFPENPIKRKYVLKVLLEAFDIKPDNEGPSPFDDVPVGSECYGYVKEAADLDIVDHSKSSFSPDEDCSRREAFQMLANMLDNNPHVTVPCVDQSLDPDDADFYIPDNITPANFGRVLGLAEGHFNFRSKTSLAIAGRKIPLTFSHGYNSYLTVIPESLTPIQPLGPGWTHNYNAYIQMIEVWDEDQKAAVSRWVSVRPDGAFHSYKQVENLYECETAGVHDQLTQPDSDTFVLTNKKQVVYTYERIDADDSFYMLTSVKDRNDNELTVSYEVQNDQPRITEVTGPAGRKMTFYYKSGTNLVSRIADPIVREIEFAYADGLLTGFTDAEDQQTVYTYFTTVGERLLLKTIELPKGNVIANEYEQRKLKSTRLDNQSPVDVEFKPDYASGTYETVAQTYKNSEPDISVSRSFDMNSAMTAYQVKDKNGAVVPGQEAQYSYDDPRLQNENLPTKIDHNGVVTEFEYDDRGNLMLVEKTAGGKTISESFAYTDINDVKTYTDPNGGVTTFSYGNGNLSGIEDPMGNVTTFIHNSYGQVKTVVSPTHITMGYDYDEYGNLDTISVPALGVESVMDFDAASRLQSAVNFNQQETKWSYDNNDNVRKISNVKAHNNLDVDTWFEYDENENLKVIRNAKGFETVMEYEFETDLLESYAFEGSQRSYTYNDDGSLKTFTDPNGHIFTYAYDDQERLKNDGYAAYGYDAQGRLETVTKDGNAIQFSYDDFHRICEIMYNDISNSVGYVYDDAGNITKMIYPGDKTVTYGYDANNRMKTVTDWNGNTTVYDYRADGLLYKTTYPNGVVSKYDYDDASRMIAMTTARNNGEGAVIAGYTFVPDNLGNHLKETVVEPFTGSPALTSETIIYEYNTDNRIEKAGDIEFAFDSNGNTKSKTGKTFAYDVKNNLTNVSGTFNATYEYDGLGHRRSRTVDGQTSRYVLDILGMSKTLMETDENGVPLHYCIHGLGLISRIDPDNTTRYYCYDYRGSTIAMVDDTTDANITHKYQYDDFGNVINSEEEDINHFQYDGRYGVMYETEDLYFMRTRYYDPEIGRFLSEDPVFSQNVYVYASNNPIVNIDPKGLLFSSIVDFFKDIAVGLDPRNAYSLGAAVYRGIKNDGQLTLSEDERKALSKVEKMSDNVEVTAEGGLIVAASVISGPTGFEGAMTILGARNKAETFDSMMNGDLSSSGATKEVLSTSLDLVNIGSACNYADITLGTTGEWIINGIDTMRNLTLNYAFNAIFKE